MIARCNMFPLQLVSTFSLRATLHEVELSSTFCNDCSNLQSPLHSVTTPPATCLAMLCSISQSGSLLSSPQSSSVAVLRVAGSPIAQCNTPVRATAMLRETSCTKNCLVVTAPLLKCLKALRLTVLLPAHVYVMFTLSKLVNS